MSDPGGGDQSAIRAHTIHHTNVPEYSSLPRHSPCIGYAIFKWNQVLTKWHMDYVGCSKHRLYDKVYGLYLKSKECERTPTHYLARSLLANPMLPPAKTQSSSIQATDSAAAVVSQSFFSFVCSSGSSNSSWLGNSSSVATIVSSKGSAIPLPLGGKIVLKPQNTRMEIPRPTGNEQS